MLKQNVISASSSLLGLLFGPWSTSVCYLRMISTTHCAVLLLFAGASISYKLEVRVLRVTVRIVLATSNERRALPKDGPLVLVLVQSPRLWSDVRIVSLIPYPDSTQHPTHALHML